MSLSYKDVKNFQIGNIVWNSSPRGNTQLEIITVPVETFSTELNKHQLRWECLEVESRKIVKYLLTEGMEHYGPSLYRTPAYVTFEHFADLGI